MGNFDLFGGHRERAKARRAMVEAAEVLLSALGGMRDGLIHKYGHFGEFAADDLEHLLSGCRDRHLDAIRPAPALATIHPLHPDHGQHGDAASVD